MKRLILYCLCKKTHNITSLRGTKQSGFLYRSMIPDYRAALVMKKKRVLLPILYSLLVALVSVNTLQGQDPQFSQFYSSPLYLSPSLTGATEHTRFAMNFRDQWPNLPNAFITYAVSADHYLENYNSGLGFLFLRDQEGGAYNVTNFGLTYSYFIKLNREWNIIPAFKAGYFNRNIDWNNLAFGDAISRNATTIETPTYEKVHHYDFTSSLLLYSFNYWAGFTVDHMLAINSQFANDPTYPSMKYTVYGGAKFNKSKIFLSDPNESYTISFLYKNQARVSQLDVGANYEQGPLRVGVWFRGVPVFSNSTALNALVLLLGYTYQNLYINYSYDISTSRLLSSTGGAHEVSLVYVIKDDQFDKKSRRGAVPCPHF